MVVNNFEQASAFVLLNQGNGTFVREAAGRLPSSIEWKLYFTIELVDIDEDGSLDLILGGHEWAEESTTEVLLNPGKNDFSAVQPVALPPVSGEGVVLDFTLTGTGGNRSIWILRTSGGDGTFYQGRVVQKVRWPSLASSIVLSQRPAQWLPWLIPAVVNGQSVVGSDDANAGVFLSAGAWVD